MRRGSLFWGSILLIAGVLLLLDNLGILKVNIWGILWSLFLIALGVSFLWGVLFRKGFQEEVASVPLEGASQAELRLRHGAGRLRLSAGTEPEDLLKGSFGGGVDIDRQRNGANLRVQLSVPAQMFPFFGWSGDRLDWTLQVNRQVPLVLRVETGANESRLDLSELQVREIHLKSGASSTEVVMPVEAGFTRGEIESGAASVRVIIPENVAARIRVSSGLSEINVNPGRFPKSGDIYESPEYATAPNKVELYIQSGVGSVFVG